MSSKEINRMKRESIEMRFFTRYRMKTLSLHIPVLFFLLYYSTCYADQYSSSPFNVVNDIAVEGDLLWCAANGGVIQWNKQTGNYTTYTTEDGLIYDYVRSVEIDHNGVKWFGTNKGISTFDGVTWTSLMNGSSLDPNIFITDLFVDSRNIVWIIKLSSVIRIDADTGNELSDENVYGLKCCTEAESGIMWFGSNRGVFSYDGETWKNYTFDNIWANEVKDIAVDNEGIVWAVTNGGGILSYNMEEWTIYTEENHLSFYSGYAVCVDNNGVKWFAPSGRGLTSYDNSSWVYHKMNDYSFRNLVRDGDIIWGSGGNKGVIGFNDSTWTHFVIPSEIIQNIFTSAVVAPDNTKWFGSDGFGVYSVNEYGTFSYSTNDGLPSNTVVSVGVDYDGSVWAKSDDERFARFDGDKWETFGTCSVEFPNHREAVYGNETWIADLYDFKLTRFSNGEITSFYESLPISSVAVDANGHIWAGGRTTIAHMTVSYYDGTDWTTYPIEAGKNVSAIVVDHDNTVWFCTDRAGIWSYDGQNWRHYIMNGYSLSVLGEEDGTVVTDTYFPMAVGNYWLYKHRYVWDWREIEITDKLIMTIVGTREIDGVTYFKFLDGRLMRVGEDDNVYRGKDLFYDFTPSGEPYDYEVPGNYVTRVHNTVEVPIGTCEGYDFNIHFWEHGYHEVLTRNLGIVFYRFRNDTGGSDMYELSEAYIDGVKYTDWTTDVKENRPVEFVSLDSYPNPFNSSTTIRFSLAEDNVITLTIYNSAGQKIETIVDDYLKKGSYSIIWSGSKFSTGIYFCHLKTGNTCKTRKLLLVK